MKLEEANNRLNRLTGIRFGQLFSPEDMRMIIVNKGRTGQLLEISLGMHLSSTTLDFEDGELKDTWLGYAEYDSFAKFLEDNGYKK